MRTSGFALSAILATITGAMLGTLTAGIFR